MIALNTKMPYPGSVNSSILTAFGKRLDDFAEDDDVLGTMKGGWHIFLKLIVAVLMLCVQRIGSFRTGTGRSS